MYKKDIRVIIFPEGSSEPNGRHKDAMDKEREAIANSDKSLIELGWVAIAEFPGDNTDEDSPIRTLVNRFIMNSCLPYCETLMVVSDIDGGNVRYWAKDISSDTPILTQLCCLYDIEQEGEVVAVIPPEGFSNNNDPYYIYKGKAIADEEQLKEIFDELYRFHRYKECTVNSSLAMQAPICGRIQVGICEYTDVACITSFREPLIYKLERGRYHGKEEFYLCQTAWDSHEDKTGNQRCGICNRMFTRDLVHIDGNTDECTCDECVMDYTYSMYLSVYRDEMEFRNDTEYIKMIRPPHERRDIMYAIEDNVPYLDKDPDSIKPTERAYLAPSHLSDPILFPNYNNRSNRVTIIDTISEVYVRYKIRYTPESIMQSDDKEDGFIVVMEHGDIIFMLVYIKPVKELEYKLIGCINSDQFASEYHRISIAQDEDNIVMYINYRKESYGRSYIEPRAISFNKNKNKELMNRIIRKYAERILKGDDEK